MKKFILAILIAALPVRASITDKPWSVPLDRARVVEYCNIQFIYYLSLASIYNWDPYMSIAFYNRAMTYHDMAETLTNL